MKKIILLLGLCFSFSLSSFAQFSATDSSFLIPIFNETIYNDDSLFPGDWYVNPTFDSLSGLFNLIDSNFKFDNNQFPANDDSIHNITMEYDTLLNNTFNYYYQNYQNAYYQNDPLIKINFRLNNITSTAYTTLTSDSFDTTCNMAIFIIPGSDPNQTTNIIRGEGYHNSNCYVKNYFKQQGDVYIYCKPLEDYRAIRWNGKKLNSGDYLTPGSSSYVYTYLKSINKSFGKNYLIECMAIVKYLKQKYKKVIIAGCSLGGYSTLLLSSLSKIDGCIVASGYSTAFDADTSVLYELSQNFDSIPYTFTKNHVKNDIEAEPSTKYLFSYANLDNIYYQREHDSAWTQSFMSPTTNCWFDTSFNYHSFPPCNILDSFTTMIKNTPKAHFTYLSSSNIMCTALVKMCGTGPYFFDLYRDSTFVNHYVMPYDTLKVSFNITGVYSIKNITNLAGDLSTCSDTISFQYVLPESTVDFNTDMLTAQINNPFDNYINIQFNKTPSNIEMSLYSSQGQKLISMTEKNKSKITIDTQTLSKGIYFLTMQYNHQQRTFKLVK